MQPPYYLAWLTLASVVSIAFYLCSYLLESAHIAEDSEEDRLWEYLLHPENPSRTTTR
jgi:hypothetical protein